MGNIADNRTSYDEYFKKKVGSEWSKDWGSTDIQWYGALLPRIHSLVPTGTILELAPGAGRWTEFLKDLCSHLILVDVSAEGIRRCQERFSDCINISYHTNDGMSLSMVADHSVDFIFSFNSLVHADEDAMEAYIAQFASKLTKDGVGFIHHSNLNHYSRLYARCARSPILSKYLLKWVGLDEVYQRSFDISAEKFRNLADVNGLCCISQELITWRGAPVFLDCLTMFTRKGSRLERSNKVVWNGEFRREAKYLAGLSDLYSYESIYKNSRFASAEAEDNVDVHLKETTS